MESASERGGEIHLLGFGVADLLLVNPVRGLLILGVIDFLEGVNSGLKVFEEAAGLVAFAVEKDVVSIIRAI